MSGQPNTQLGHEAALEEPSSSTAGMIIQEDKTDPVVILRLNDSFLRTIAGVLRFLQIVVSTVSLVCVLSSGTTFSGHLLLPHSNYLRIFIFSSVCGMFSSLLRIFLEVTSLIEMLDIKWHIYDLVTCVALALLYFIASSLLAAAVVFYQAQSRNTISEWTIEQLNIAMVLGFIGMLLFMGSAIHSYHGWKGLTQFVPQRFSTRSSPPLSSSSSHPDSNPIV